MAGTATVDDLYTCVFPKIVTPQTPPPSPSFPPGVTNEGASQTGSGSGHSDGILIAVVLASVVIVTLTGLIVWRIARMRNKNAPQAALGAKVPVEMIVPTSSTLAPPEVAGTEMQQTETKI